MHIVIPTFERIEWMPPTITLINELVAQGHTISYITIFPDSYYSHFDQNKVKNVFLYKREISILKYVSSIKGVAGVAFRMDRFTKKLIAMRLKGVIDGLMDSDSILWVVNELTVMIAGSRFLKNYKYIFTIYELHPNSFKVRHVKKAAQGAFLTVIPEYNRSHIQKFFFNLKKLPIVLPNKPIMHPRKRNMDVDGEVYKKIFDIKQSGKKIVMYLGIVSEERPLEKIIEVMKSMKDRFELVIIGRRSAYLQKLEEEYPDHFTYLGYFTAPLHLNVASYADIGLLIYVSEGNKHGLNAIYCAPNKIFEYTGFGLPLLANNIPGLYYPIEASRAGRCVDFNNTNEIKSAFVDLLDHYEDYSLNSTRFYESIDISKGIENILNRFVEEN